MIYDIGPRHRVSLTDEDVTLLTMLSNGIYIKKIARDTHVTHTSIDRRLREVKQLLRADTMAHAVAVALRAGIIQ